MSIPPVRVVEPGTPPPPTTLPDRPPGRSAQWSGAVLLVVIESIVIGSLIFSYFYLRLGVPLWPPAGIDPPALGLPILAQALLLASAVPAFAWERAVRAGRERGARLAVVPGGLLALGYLVVQGVQLAGLEYRWSTHAYGSITWTLAGYSMLHVVALLFFALVVWAFLLRRPIEPRLVAAVEVAALYWYFVAASSLFVFGTLYVSPRVL